MTKLALVALVLINAAFASQVFLGNKNTMHTGALSALKAIESSEFGKNLLDTIALQIKANSPLSDVAQLLGELKSDLLHQQHEDDQLWADQQEDCRTTIARLEGIIADAAAKIAEATARIIWLKDRIRQLEESIATAKAAIETIEELRRVAIADRAAEAARYANRKEQHETVLGALNLILDKLNAYGSHSEGDEHVFLQLAKIGKSNPIMAFIELAASLEPGQWDNLKGKITELRDRTLSSGSEDAAQESAQIESHANQLEAWRIQLEDLHAQVDREETELGEHRVDLTGQEATLETNTNIWNQATADLAAKHQQCDDWKAGYEARTAQRSSEVGIVEQVQAIFANRIETAKEYLKTRIDQ